MTLDRKEAGPEGPVRHAFIEIGPHTVLHPFEVPGVDVPGRQPIETEALTYGILTAS